MATATHDFVSYRTFLTCVLSSAYSAMLFLTPPSVQVVKMIFQPAGLMAADNTWYSNR